MYKRIAAVMFVALESLTLFFTPSYAHEGINYRLPTLESIVPPAFSIIDTGTVDISGRIVTELNILSLRIDGKPVKFSGSKFTISNLPLSIGKNVFIFELLDSSGKRKFYSYTLYRKEELREDAKPLPEAAGAHETETNKVSSTDTPIVAEGFTPAVIASKSPAVAPASTSTPQTSGYSINNNNAQIISVVQQVAGGVAAEANVINNLNPQTDTAQTPVPDNKENDNNGGPVLSFSSPYENQVITGDALQIGGRFSESAHVNNITIGGQKCTMYPASFTFTGPTLLSPGEAYRRNVEGDSPDCIVMDVDPYTHAGKNILTAQITDDSGHITEEKITFYYYQLLVQIQTTGESCVFPIVEGIDENGRYYSYEDTKNPQKVGHGYVQMYNRDLFYKPPFGNWADTTSNWREYFPYMPWSDSYDIDPKGFSYHSSSDWAANSCGVSNFPWLARPLEDYIVENDGDYAINGATWDKTVTTLHSPPLKDRTFIVIFKNCHFIETEGMFNQVHYGPFPDWHKAFLNLNDYKISSVIGSYELRPLYGDFSKKPSMGELGAYVIMDNPSPDRDFDITIDAPSYGAGFGFSSGFCNKLFSCSEIQDLSGNILVDANNDGLLGGDDNVVKQVPPGCVFWVNDNDSYDESTVHTDDADAVNSHGNDSSDNSINGIRDLEDFMPINLTIPNIKEWATNQNVKFYLKAEGEGRIKIYERVNDMRDFGSLTYLKDLNSSTAEYKKEMKFSLPSSGKEGQLLDPSWFDTEGNFHGIFEGAGKGELKLTLQVDLNGKKIDLDSAIITLKDIKDMYKLCNIRYKNDGKTEGTETDPSDNITKYMNNHESGNIYPSNPDTILIWTHGFNSDLKQSYIWIETVYKRLYQTGYRGGFVGITWNGNSDFFSAWGRSYQTGPIIAKIIEDTKKDYPNSNIDLGAHSLGNNIVCYSLRLLATRNEKIVHDLILMEGAVPAVSYSGTDDFDFYRAMTLGKNKDNKKLIENYKDHANPEDIYNEDTFFNDIYGLDTTAISGHIYNTYSKNDKVLWEYFEIALFKTGLLTPLNADYKLTNNWSLHDSSFGGLGYHEPYSAHSNFESKSFYNYDVMEWNLVTRRPYGIREHSSMRAEYYYDVKELYEDIYKNLTE